MRTIITIATVSALILVFATGLTAQSKSTIFGTVHDITSLSGGCKSCHVPHQSSAKGEVLLWAQDFTTTASFGVYNSPTMDSAPQDVGGVYSPTNLPSGAKMYTVLCLSCHDGLTTTSVITATDGAAIANPSNSDGLKNDHPVNMTWPTGDAGLETPTSGMMGTLPLYSDTGVTDSVQCASCHNVHDFGSDAFLRIAESNTKAGLCTTCHK